MPKAEDLPGIPGVCPTCGASWTGWIVGPHDGKVMVNCTAGHDHSFSLIPEDELRAELLLRPELLHKPAHFEGGPYDGEVRAIAALDGKQLGDTIGSD